MRHDRTRRPPPTLCGLLVLAGLACTHPQSSTPSTKGTGGGTGSTGTPGQPGPGPGGGAPTGAGGAGQTPGTGGAAGTPREEIVDTRADGGAAPAAVMKMSCGDSTAAYAYASGYQINPTAVTEAKAVLDTMTLTEKADQMRGTPHGNNSNYADIFRTPDNSAKGIRGFKFRDGPRGLNLAAENPAGKQGYATSFPVSIARGASFDLDLEYRIGQAHGDETVAGGYTMMLAPTVNILRHPAWGRTQETYGEDVFHLGRFGTAYTIGVQEYVPACVKHYAANNIENGRSNANAMMDEQTLREIYTRHFEMVIKDGGVACVMASYNLVNGTKATQSKHILTDILRTDFGFKGFVLSDWWAMPPGQAGVGQDVLKSNAAQAVQAGMDMELPWSFNYGQIESITGAGRPLMEALVTTSAQRILEQKFRFKVARVNQPIGLKPAKTTLNAGTNSIQGNDAHIALAQEAAVKGMVLLKNDKGTLPIKRASTKTIAVIGAEVPYKVIYTDQAEGTIRFAESVRTGDLGSSRVFHDPAKASGPAAGIKEVAGAGITVMSGADPNLANAADFVVVVAGLTPEDEGEEYTGAGDRPNFKLDGKKGGTLQNNLIGAVAAKGKPMAVVLVAGSVIEMPWLDQVPAVVMAWYPGMDGGRALGKLLFGDANFSGKLPITWPKRWEDEPPFSTGTTTMMDYHLGYRHFDKNNIAPLYPFGHGLSYTTYEYSNLQVPCSDVTRNGIVDVKVDVRNTGMVKGDEVVMLFVSYPGSTVRRSVKELKAFTRVSLDPGVTKRVTIPLRIADLKYFDMASSSWKVDAGMVQIQVGPNAASLMLKDTLVIK